MIAAPAAIRPAVRLIVVAVLLAAAAAAHGATAQQTAASPEDAMRRQLAARGLDYAGDCADPSLPANDGRWCARFVAGQAGLRAYVVGPTGAAASHWLFVEAVGPGWQPRAIVPLDPTAPAGVIPWPA